MIKISNKEYILELELWDIIHEVDYWHEVISKVVSKPVENWWKIEWKTINLEDYKIIDYMVTDEWIHYMNLFLPDETYYRIYNERKKRELAVINKDLWKIVFDKKCEKLILKTTSWWVDLSWDLSLWYRVLFPSNYEPEIYEIEERGIEVSFVWEKEISNNEIDNAFQECVDYIKRKTDDWTLSVKTQFEIIIEKLVNISLHLIQMLYLLYRNLIK